MDSKKQEIEPKNAHGVNFNLCVNSNDADVIREALISAGHVKLSEKLETKREIEIMREVKENGGIRGGGIEKTLEKWRKGNYYESIDTKEPKYKMKHRVLNAVNS
jgi:hypothetical protein